MRWQERAACRDVSIEVFYPDADAKKGRGIYAEALTYCRRCEVRDECLDSAQAVEGFSDNTGRHGMFGGLTPRQRAKMRPDQTCVICEVSFRGHANAQVCSERCAKVRDARYQYDWQQQNRSAGREGWHGTNKWANSGCLCPVCRNHRRARAREERVRKAMRARQDNVA